MNSSLWLKKKCTFRDPPLPTGALSIEVEYKAKSSYPVVPSPSIEGTIGQNIIVRLILKNNMKLGKSYSKNKNLVQTYLCQRVH